MLANSMYKGTQLFTREQLVFIVQANLHAAFDKVHGALPTGCSTVTESELDAWNKNEYELLHFIWGAVHNVGIFVPILWAQTEGQRLGEGMGNCDFEGWQDFEGMVQNFIDHHMTVGNKTQWHPDCRELAEKIVDVAWKEYFEFTNEHEVVRASDLKEGDSVDLSHCPYMSQYPSAEFEYAEVVYVTPPGPKSNVISVGYEGVDEVGYDKDERLVIKKRN